MRRPNSHARAAAMLANIAYTPTDASTRASAPKDVMSSTGSCRPASPSPTAARKRHRALQREPAIDGRELVLHGLEQRHRVAAGAQHECGEGPRTLPARAIQHGLRVRPGAIVAHVADNADDLHHRRPGIRVETNAGAERVAIRPETARHALADHDGRHRAQAIARIERASLPERDPQRSEVVVRDHCAEHEGRSLVRLLRRTVDEEAGAAAAGRRDQGDVRDGLARRAASADDPRTAPGSGCAPPAWDSHAAVSARSLSAHGRDRSRAAPWSSPTGCGPSSAAPASRLTQSAICPATSRPRSR